MLASSWYRVSGLRPRLRGHARLYRHRYRGELWYLLQDPISNRVHRFTPAARVLIAAMDGKRSVQQLWEIANRQLGESAPTQDEVINLLGQLHAADLLQSDVTPDSAEVFDRGSRQDKASKQRSYMNPMALRIHLFDPDRLLNRMRGFVDWLWGRWGVALWLAVMLPALMLLPVHWNELTNDFSDRVLAIDNLLLLWLVFPVIKALHEFGHASATKHGGGEVHDMGVVMLVMIPVPYVEASASSVFKSKYRRALVGAAGMAVELFIAGLCFLLWLLIEPGIVRALLFNAMLVAGVSTLVFNGNPLLRYDAYYILADLLEMPNLANRSLRYWGYLIERHAFGVEGAEAPAGSTAEKAWLVSYGVGSTVYRVIVTVGIALFVAGEFFVVGVLLAIWAMVTMIMVPIGRTLQHLGSNPRLRLHRSRAWSVSAAFVGIVALVLFVLPAPFRTTVEGVIWLPEQALVRAGAAGFVDKPWSAPGAPVAAGDVLFRLREASADMQLQLATAKVAEAEVAYGAQLVAERAGAGIALERLESERKALLQASDRADRLIVRAAIAGTFVVPRAADMPGRYYRQGELLGYVVEPSERPLARVVVGQEAVDSVRLATERVFVRRAHQPDLPLTSAVLREVPAGEAYLPSRALSTEGGGHLAIDPRDQKGAKTLERTFQFDIGLPAEADNGAVFFGERVHVRFDHPSTPIGNQWLLALRRLFLSHFHV